RNSGLTYLFNEPKAFWLQLVILIVATVLFIICAWSGLGKGINILSSVNMCVAAALVTIVFVVGLSMSILNLFTTTIGYYEGHFLEISLQLKPLSEQGRAWINEWTIFYWAWWILWSPFVGMFIARVSKGRTVRQFVAGVLLAPTLVTIIFFFVFG